MVGTVRRNRQPAAGSWSRGEAGAYALTAVCAALRRDAPRSLAALADVFTDPLMVRGWERLDDVVRSGRPVFPEVFGTGYFDDPPAAEATALLELQVV
ncbi:hypothetical protein ACQEU8_01865 [Streptomyces sp. CA-250714]|uniref:hypothetical protein n=1 Tax=Streptomyces sp. CA-250714 TaxID=3240060 RepID=UPI003D91FC22